MNNINSADSSRAVVTDVNVNRGNAKPETAKRESAGGKDLPDTQAKQSDVRNQQVSQDRGAQRAERVERAVEQLNDYAQSLQRDLKFKVDEDLGRAVVSVVDRSTQKVIRQIPDETAIELARNLKDRQIDLQLPGTGGNADGSQNSLDLINTRI